MPIRPNALLLVSLLISTVAFAQNKEFSLTLGGTGSVATSVPFFWEGKDPVFHCEGIVFNTACLPNTTVQAAPGFSIEAAYAWRMASFKPVSFYLELPVLYVPNSDYLGTGASGHGAHSSSVFVTPSLKFKLWPGARISPFASLGAGLVHYDKTSHGTFDAFQIGGGVDIKTPIPMLSVRAEVKNFYAERPLFADSYNALNNNPPFLIREHSIFIGAGIVLHPGEVRGHGLSSRRDANSDPATNSITMYGAGTFANDSIFGGAYDRHLFFAAAQFSHIIATTPVMTVGYAVEAVPLARLSQPAYVPGGELQRRVPYSYSEISYGAGGSPVGFDVHFLPKRRLQPVVNVNGGFLFFSRNIPAPEAAQFNFALTGRVGLSVHLHEGRSFSVGYMFQHLSNAHTAVVNMGMDSEMLYTSYTFGLGH